MVRNAKPMKLAFLIRDLGSGGAERQLVLLANELCNKYQIVIITFYDRNNFYVKQLNRNIEFISLNKKGRWDIIPFFLRFFRVMKRHKPALLYAFMHTAEFLTYLYHFFDKRLLVVWSVRSSDMDISRYGMLYRIMRKIECKISNTPNAIISNSFAGKKIAIKDGFKNENIQVVHNGIETNKFKYSSNARIAIRKQLGVDEHTIIIGLVARHDPMKGIINFIEAARIYSISNPYTCFLVLGSGPCDYTLKLKNFAKKARVNNLFLWVPTSENIEQYYSAMDIYTSTSIYGEGFSNTIGEAMSCNLPCVVTNVGDSSIIVGNTGIVVEPFDIQGIVRGWEKIVASLKNNSPLIFTEQRKRICENFSIEQMSLKTEKIILNTIQLTS
jgi:glycosyltransferase involved in cell wall biosynthesis